MAQIILISVMVLIVAVIVYLTWSGNKSNTSTHGGSSDDHNPQNPNENDKETDEGRSI